jgi:hypothetical protein
MATSNPHKRFTKQKVRKVTFLLQDSDGTLRLVPSIMPVTITDKLCDRNVYSGPVETAWQALPAALRRMKLRGVLVSEMTREFQYDIQWVEPSNG